MRPVPVHPRGPRRSPASRPTRHVFGCPRISPEWELGAFHALIKPRPERAGFIQRTKPQQPWNRHAAEVLNDVCRIVAERLEYEPALHVSPAGDYHFVAEVTEADIPLARAMSLLLSRRLSGTWFVVGKVFVKDGRFFRRERGYKLNLVEATNVHLPRDIRGALRGVL